LSHHDEAKAEPLLQKVEEYLLNRKVCRRVQLLEYLGETGFTVGTSPGTPTPPHPRPSHTHTPLHSYTSLKS